MSSECGYENFTHYFNTQLTNLFDQNIFLAICCYCLVLSILVYIYLEPIDEDIYKQVLETQNNKIVTCDTCELPYELEERMKFWEKRSQKITQIDPRLPFIVRFDGCCFSKFTNKLKKLSSNNVFSAEFSNAMIKTSCDLLLKFRPTTVYTHSDEITLIFQNYVQFDESLNEILTGEHYRNGKVYKLLSELASFTSVSFTKNIANEFKNDSDVLDFLNKQTLTFDARIIVFPSKFEYEIVNHMIWRTRDCYRNYVSAHAEKHFSQKQLNNVNTNDRIKMLKTKQVDLTDETKLNHKELGMKYGMFFKLFKSNKDCNFIQSFYCNKLQFSDELLNFLMFPLKELTYFAENNDSTPKHFALDSYEFEDCFNGTFQIEIKKQK